MSGRETDAATERAARAVALANLVNAATTLRCMAPHVTCSTETLRVALDHVHCAIGTLRSAESRAGSAVEQIHCNNCDRQYPAGMWAELRCPSCGAERRYPAPAELVCSACHRSSPASTWPVRQIMGAGNGLERRCPHCLRWQYKGRA